MEGPYRDLGSGFVRLTGTEGVRRSPSRINCVEDALRELLQNARDAGAENIYVSSSLRARRYRTLTILDDGHGIPETHKDIIFEPGVTTRHLSSAPAPSPNVAPKTGSGVSLFHIKNTAIEAEVLSTKGPTSIQATFDAHELPERVSQSRARTSGTNLRSTIQTFISETTTTPPPNIHYGTPAAVLSTLTKNRIIPPNVNEPSGLKSVGDRLGLGVSLRTAQRIWRGEIASAGVVVSDSDSRISESKIGGGHPHMESEARLKLVSEEILEIATILGRAARTRYLEVGGIEVESRPGEIILRSRVYEPEEEYE